MTQLEQIEQHLLDAVKAIRKQRKQGGSRAALYAHIEGTCHAVVARCQHGDTTDSGPSFPAKITVGEYERKVTGAVASTVDGTFHTYTLTNGESVLKIGQDWYFRRPGYSPVPVTVESDHERHPR